MEGATERRTCLRSSSHPSLLLPLLLLWFIEERRPSKPEPLTNPVVLWRRLAERLTLPSAAAARSRASRKSS